MRIEFLFANQHIGFYRIQVILQDNGHWRIEFDEIFWKARTDHLYLHGHMTPPSKNNLEDNFVNLMKMPRDAEFKFVSEVVNDQDSSLA